VQAKLDPVVSEPVVSEPVVSEPVVSEPVVSDPFVSASQILAENASLIYSNVHPVYSQLG